MEAVQMIELTSPGVARSSQRFADDRRAAAMVEFAIVLPILLMFIFASIDFGRAYFLYNNLANAAREGARLGAVQFPDPRTSVAVVQARVRERIATFGGTANANDATVNVTFTPNVGVVQTITVQVQNFPFSAITPLPQLQNITITTQAAFRHEGAL
jgi:Flp pilus assembly protein TadG